MSKKRPHYIYHNTKLDLYLLFKTYKELESTTGISSSTVRNNLAEYRRNKNRYWFQKDIVVYKFNYDTSDEIRAKLIEKSKQGIHNCCGVLETLDIIWADVCGKGNIVPLAFGEGYQLHKVNKCPSCGRSVKNIQL